MKRNSKNKSAGSTVPSSQRPVQRQAQRPVQRPMQRPDARQTQMSRDEIKHINSKKRRRKQKRIRLALYTLLLLVFLSVAIVLSLTVFFKIGSIEVTGSSIYGNTDIINVSEIQIGDNLFLIDAKGITKKITGTLPYIGEAKVRRKLPATILIEVTDTREYAAFDGENGYILINENGKVLSDSASVVREDVAYIGGLIPTKAVLCETVEFENAETLSNVTRILTAIKDAQITNITDINMSDISLITLEYDGRILLKAGGIANIERKLLRAAEAIKKEDERNPSTTGTLDLTIDPYAYFRESKETTQPQTVKATETTSATKNTTEAPAA